MDLLFTFADGVGMGLIIWLLFADVIGWPVCYKLHPSCKYTIPRWEKIIFRFAFSTQTKLVISVDSCALKRWNGEGKKF